MAAVLAYPTLRADPVVFASGETQSSLLELYTSEGCSSCPPAEAWLSALKNQPDLWRDVVPVAFHVDYWNSLGWPDRFASPRFTVRQRAYAERWGESSVYTPEFVRNGQEWRPSTALPPRSPKNVGSLKVTLRDRQIAEIEFHPSSPLPGPLTAFLVPLGMNIVSDVRSGENGGRKLAHDFVALALLDTTLQRDDHGVFTGSIKLPPGMPESTEALAAWVSSGPNEPPIQAAGGLVAPRN